MEDWDIRAVNSGTPLEVAWDWLDPPFFFFLDLDDVFVWAGVGSVLRPGMITTGGGSTNVSILKFVMFEYPGVGDCGIPGI